MMSSCQLQLLFRQDIQPLVIVPKVHLIKLKNSDCEEETDQNVYTTTVAKPMLSVKVHTELPSDLAAVPTESPTQPKIIFPLRKFGMRRPHGFSREWYRSYQWLEYSVERDAAFCFPCRMFKVGSSR